MAIPHQEIWQIKNSTSRVRLEKHTWFMVGNINISTMPTLSCKKGITYAHRFKL